MTTWIKHTADKITESLFTWHDKTVKIVTCSRHGKDNKLRGYIVKVLDSAGYSQIRFKHYTYREVVVLSAWTDYRLGVF